MYVYWNVFMLAVILWTDINSLISNHQHPLLVLKGCIRIQILQQRHWLRSTESMECLSSLLWGRALDRLWQVPINPILVRCVWCWKRSACVLDASVWGRARCLLLFPWTHSTHKVLISAWKEAGSQVGWENYHELSNYLSACITETYCQHLTILHGDP